MRLKWKGFIQSCGWTRIACLCFICTCMFEWKWIITSKMHNSKSKNPGRFKETVSLAAKDLQGQNVPGFTLTVAYFAHNN